MAQKAGSPEPMNSQDGPAYPIRAVDRVCDILDALQRAAGGVSLADVAASTGLPKSSAYRYLARLEARRYVERDEAAGTYRLGLAFHPQHTRHIDLLITCSRPQLEELRDRFGETTNLGILDGSEVLHTAVLESPHMMRLAARVGDRGRVHSTALGKAMLADLPDERVRSVLATVPMTAFTDRTITAPDRYLTELSTVRARGYALDDCENQPDGRCVAVSLHGMAFPCGISVSAPASRLARSHVGEVARSLRESAAQVVQQYQRMTAG